MSLYRNIDRSKYQFDFICASRKKICYEDEIKKLGGRIFYVTPRSESIIRNIKETEEIFKSNNYKIVHWHANTLNNNIPAMIALKRPNTNVIIHSHSCWKSKNIKSLLYHYWHFFLLLKKKIVKMACSDDAGKWMFKSNDFELIRNGVNISKFLFNSNSREKIRKSLNINSETTVLGHVGGFNEAKNHTFLVDVFAKYLELNPDSLLVLIGSGRLESNIRNKVKTLGIEEKVIFIGECKNTNEYYSAFDMFVFPSVYEGLGIALIEAQISGLQCFISDSIPCDAIITENVLRESVNNSSEHWANVINNNFKKNYSKDIKLEDKILLYDDKKLAQDVQKKI